MEQFRFTKDKELDEIMFQRWLIGQYEKEMSFEEFKNKSIKVQKNNNNENVKKVEKENKKNILDDVNFILQMDSNNTVLT